jgi:hypothetical protein
MPTPPQLTDEQRQAALAKAAEARRVRAEIKNRLKIGSLSLPELLDEADKNETVAKIKVLAVLESLPGVGKVTARRKLDELGIAESRRLSGLGPQQRQALVGAFS